MEIKGHPELILESDPVEEFVEVEPGLYRKILTPPQRVTITLCAECERMRTVLFLSGDRWFCTACRASGDARPTMIPLTTRRT